MTVSRGSELIMDNHLKEVIFGPMRLPFLVLTPACVMLGAATADWSGSPVNFYHLALALIGAVGAHISVNALNEYHDFASGLDFHTEPTPFSGGSGTLPRNPYKSHVALITGIFSMGVTVSVGIYFLRVRGLWLLPVGLLGLVTIATYTKWITRNAFLCLIAPGLGFGPFMVMGTDFVLTGTYSWSSFIASLVPFFLVSDLLLLNQFPDVEADRTVGRHHFPISIGRKASVSLYAAFLGSAYATVIIGYMVGQLPLEGFLALGSIVFAIPTVRGLARFADNVPELIPYMGRNVVIIILTPVLLAIGLFIGH
ncbi:MAG: prenyltransferase [Deltaproteobacteria bacterium]|jgi:1,4-dihydroxy-2-naphthoate octaprenyltransferase